LRAENVKKDAAQGGGVDTDSPRSETQTDEGVRTFTQADDEAEKKLLMAPLPAIGGNAAFNFSRTSSS